MQMNVNCWTVSRPGETTVPIQIIWHEGETSVPTAAVPRFSSTLVNRLANANHQQQQQQQLPRSG